MRVQLVDHSETWTKWFAWYPVCIGSKPTTLVWLERVERRLIQLGCDDMWEYRFIREN